MKVFLMIAGGILLYLVMFAITAGLFMYMLRLDRSPEEVYRYDDRNIIAGLFWPVILSPVILYLFYGKIKVILITMIEIKIASKKVDEEEADDAEGRGDK